MADPLAFLLTWVCYGAWLHGDARGSVDDEHNAPGSDAAPASVHRRAVHAARMRDAPIILTDRERWIVDGAIREHCEHRSWWLGACNVRTNHVHCVIGYARIRPETAVRSLKSWSTRALRRHDADRFAGSVWARQGSTRYLWSRDEVARAMRYVLEAQDDPRRWARDAE
jgi:REP element-mobilizing transposase RayT